MTRPKTSVLLGGTELNTSSVKGQLRVLIIGAGAGGLMTAIVLARHGVRSTILEKLPQLSPASSAAGVRFSDPETGTGLQIPPNGVRILQQLDVLDKIMGRGGQILDFIDHLSWEDGTVIRRRDLTDCEDLYGAPWITVHSEDYLRVLYTEAQRSGVSVMFNCHIVGVDTNMPSVTLDTGMIIKGDVIIGADGIWSNMRRKIMSSPPVIRPTGGMAYRSILTADQLLSLNSPRITEIVKDARVGQRIWLGPNSYVVLYPIKGRKRFNIVAICADNIPSTESQDGCFPPVGANPTEIRKLFGGWDPIVREMLSRVTKATKWKLCFISRPDTCVVGNVCLIGDAAHPILPFIGQGSAAASEDAIVLGTLVGLASTHLLPLPDWPLDLNHLLRLYEWSRSQYITTLAKVSIRQGRFNLLSNSSEQIVRDEIMAKMEFNMLDADGNERQLDRWDREGPPLNNGLWCWKIFRLNFEQRARDIFGDVFGQYIEESQARETTPLGSEGGVESGC